MAQYIVALFDKTTKCGIKSPQGRSRGSPGRGARGEPTRDQSTWTPQQPSQVGPPPMRHAAVRQRRLRRNGPCCGWTCQRDRLTKTRAPTSGRRQHALHGRPRAVQPLPQRVPRNHHLRSTRQLLLGPDRSSIPGQSPACPAQRDGHAGGCAFPPGFEVHFAARPGARSSCTGGSTNCLHGGGSWSTGN